MKIRVTPANIALAIIISPTFWLRPPFFTIYSVKGYESSMTRIFTMSVIMAVLAN